MGAFAHSGHAPVAMLGHSFFEIEPLAIVLDGQPYVLRRVSQRRQYPAGARVVHRIRNGLPANQKHVRLRIVRKLADPPSYIQVKGDIRSLSESIRDPRQGFRQSAVLQGRKAHGQHGAAGFPQGPVRLVDGALQPLLA